MRLLIGLPFALALYVIAMAGALPSAASQSVTYDFNHLVNGNLGGQDNWVSTPMGASTTQQHEVLVPGVTPPSDNTSVVGHDGSNAARQPFGGASITSRSTRVNNGAFSFGSITSQDAFVIELDLLPPCWGGQFYLGVDGNGDGDLAPSAGSFRLISYNGCLSGVGKAVRIIGPDGTVFTTPSLTANANDLYRYRMTFDREAFGGAGSVSVERRNLSTDGGWTELPSLQNLRMDFTRDGTAKDPSTWDIMGILSDSYDPTSLFDNITFSIDATQDATDVSQAPAPWMKQYQRGADEVCEPEWGASWAEWAYGGRGGPVCVQTWWWSPRGWFIR